MWEKNDFREIFINLKPDIAHVTRKGVPCHQCPLPPPASPDKEDKDKTRIVPLDSPGEPSPAHGAASGDVTESLLGRTYNLHPKGP